MLKNYTTETHHIVMDDGSVDFGDDRGGRQLGAGTENGRRELSLHDSPDDGRQHQRSAPP